MYSLENIWKQYLLGNYNSIEQRYLHFLVAMYESPSGRNLLRGVWSILQMSSFPTKIGVGSVLFWDMKMSWKSLIFGPNMNFPLGSSGIGSSFTSPSLPSYLSPRIISSVDGAISSGLLFALDMWCQPLSSLRYPSMCILPKPLGKLAPMPLASFWSQNGLPPLLPPLLLELPDPGPGGNGKFPPALELVNAVMSIFPDIHLEKIEQSYPQPHPKFRLLTWF